MKKIILVLLVAVLLSGCIESESIAGTYTKNRTIQHYAGYQEYQNETLIVYPDSTFVLKISGIQVYSGVVKKENDTYIFTTPLVSFTEKYENGNLTDDDGSIMVRVK